MKKISFYVPLLVMLVLSAAPAFAEKYQDPDQRFSIEVPAGWGPRAPQHEGVAASFAEPVTGATLNIGLREADPDTKAEDLHWEDLFSPKFDSVDIKMDGFTRIGGERARYCLYTLRGDFKKQMEGKQAQMYLNYVLVHGGSLYSITFTANESGFPQVQPVFSRMVRTMEFPKAS